MAELCDNSANQTKFQHNVSEWIVITICGYTTFHYTWNYNYLFGICQTKAWDNGKYSLVECLFSIKSYPYRRQSCETRWRNYARASFKFRHDNRWSLNDGPKRNTSLTLLLIQLNGWTIRSALLVDSTRIQFFLFFFFSVNWSASFEFPENQLYPLSYVLLKFCFLKFDSKFQFFNFLKKFKQILLAKYCII